jgi:hypothetical protein
MTFFQKHFLTLVVCLVATTSDAAAMGKNRADKKKKHEGSVVVDASGNKSCDIGAKYTIKEGKQSMKRTGLSDMISRTKNKNGNFEFRACFDDTAIYSLENREDQGDWNKLYGFSDCGNLHHKNSARVVWRWNDASERIEIGAYVYADKERTELMMGTVDPYEITDFSIQSDGDQYIFRFQGKSYVLPRGCSRKALKGFRLYPYFGGTSDAPHNMNVWIDEY